MGAAKRSFNLLINSASFQSRCRFREGEEAAAGSNSSPEREGGGKEGGRKERTEEGEERRSRGKSWSTIYQMPKRCPFGGGQCWVSTEARCSRRTARGMEGHLDR